MINKTVSNEGKEITYGYKLNCDDSSVQVTAKAVYDSTSENWLSVDVTSTEIRITVDENTGSSRKGYVKISVGGRECPNKSIYITQDAGEGGDCYYTVTPSTSQVECEGGTITITYKKTEEKPSGDIKFYLNGSASPSTSTSVNCNTPSITLRAKVPDDLPTLGGDIEFYLNGSQNPSTNTSVNCNTQNITLRAEINN